MMDRKRVVGRAAIIVVSMIALLVLIGCPNLVDPMDTFMDQPANDTSAEKNGNVAVALVVPVFERSADDAAVSAQRVTAQVISPSTRAVVLFLDGVEAGTLPVSTGNVAGGTWNGYFYTQWTAGFTVRARTYSTVRVELRDAGGTVLTAGEYADGVTISSGETTTINISAFPVTGQHKPLSIGGAAQSGSVAHQGMTYFSFSATAGDILNITITPTSGQPDVYLFGPTGAPTGSVNGVDYVYTGGSAKTLTHSIAQSGTYWVGVYGWSTAAAFTVGVQNASAAPSGFTASSGTSLSQIYLSWNSVTGATSYQVSYSTSQTGTYTALSTTSSTSYTHGGHGPSTVYWYKVRAYIAGTWGPESSAVRGYTKTGTPTLVSASLGSALLGTMQVSWNAVAATNGTIYYYVYRRNDPSTTSTVSLGYTQTTGGSFTVPQGTIYYFSVRAYNTITGWGEHSNLKPGYTSNIAVVYNDADTTDTSLASEIRTVLTSDLPNTYTTIYGTMPNWSVTLIPQSMIMISYNDNSVFYGKPLIVTPAVTIHTSPGRTRNVVAHGGGVVAMGEGGARLIDRTTTYWSSWGMTGTAPADIGWGKSMVVPSGGTRTYTWTSGNSMWSSPLSSDTFPGGTSPTHEARTQISYRSHTRISVYRANRDNPPSGWLYSRDDASDTHFPVVRQDRFLQFGFDSLTNRPYTGHVFFINLVRRMSQY